MLSVVLEFDVVNGQEVEFKKYWLATTEAIYQHFGSLGSRLHKADDGKFIAYAQWPDRQTYEQSHLWPHKAKELQNEMNATLVNQKARLVYKLEVDTDYLQTDVYQPEASQ